MLRAGRQAVLAEAGWNGRLCALANQPAIQCNSSRNHGSHRAAQWIPEFAAHLSKGILLCTGLNLFCIVCKQFVLRNICSHAKSVNESV